MLLRSAPDWSPMPTPTDLALDLVHCRHPCSAAISGSQVRRGSADACPASGIAGTVADRSCTIRFTQVVDNCVDTR